MAGGPELLETILNKNDVSGRESLAPGLLRFELEYAKAPDLAAERERIADILKSQNFQLLKVHDDLPNYLVLQFGDVRRQISRRGQFAIADELADKLDVSACIPEGASNFPIDQPGERQVIEGKVGDAILDLTCWSKIDESLTSDWIVDFLGLNDAWSQTKGAGIRIAQPDTGIADHQELDGNIKLDLALNIFTDKLGDATDPVTSDMGNPGHGTATASVITSKHAPVVLGVAPDAELVPIRCIDSVILGLDGSAIARAVMHARDKKAHVVSMSLGGPFVSRSLREALRLAAESGMIVVAAAGNCVGVVIYPAYDPNVIAVAGVGATGKAWKGTSKGSAVDIAAPSENVFAARRAPDDGGQHNVTPSQGTSFGTALTAGIAALWLSKHGHDAVKQRAAALGTTVNNLFRSALQKSAHKPTNWESGLGAGIVNAKALLDLSLNDIAVSPMAAVSHGVGMSDSDRIFSMAIRGEKVEDFDWGRFGPEAVYLYSDSLARRDSRVSALSESPARAEPSPTLARQNLPAPLQRALKREKDEPLGALLGTPPLDPKADRFWELRRGGLDSLQRQRQRMLSESVLESITQGGGAGLESIIQGGERIIERLNARDGNPLAKEARSEALNKGLEAIDTVRSYGDIRSVTFEGRIGLEALVRLTGRPALKIVNDTISIDDPSYSDGPWGPTLINSPQLKFITKRVGRINLDGEHVGTGFVVQDQLIMTNRHVLESIAEEVRTSRGSTWVFSFGKAEIDFSDDGESGEAYEITEVVFADQPPTYGRVNFGILDLVLLKAKTKAGFPDGLAFRSGGSSLKAKKKVLVLGYPAMPSAGAFIDPATGEFSQEISDRLGAIFGFDYGRKYVSPGEVMTPTGDFSSDPKKWVFSHDATTLAGHSGSLIVSFDGDGDKVYGLHFAGSVLTGNYAHEIAKTNIGVV